MVSSMLARKASKLPEGLSKALLEYDKYMRRRGLTTDTRYNHGIALSQFMEFLASKGVSDVSSITKGLVEEWMDYVASKYASSSSLRKFMVVKGFLKFLMAKGLDLSEAYEAVRKPKVKRRLPEVLTEDEVINLVNKIEEPRFKLFFALAYETGARKGELLSLRLADLELGPEVSRVIIRSSKSEPRVVPVIIFNRLLREYVSSLPKDPLIYLFHRKGDYRSPLAHSTVGYWFKKLSEEVGRRIYPHMLRHSRATELIRKGLSEKEVMYLLGERTREMIDVYVTLAARDVEYKLMRIYGKRAGNFYIFGGARANRDSRTNP